jgi:outer membrane protein OmpA-like peptidoglycan-associated protein
MSAEVTATQAPERGEARGRPAAAERRGEGARSGARSTERSPHPNARKAGRSRAGNVSGAFALAATLGVLFLLSPRSAQAQASTFYLDRLYMAGAPEDATALWRPKMHERTRFFGQFGLGFGLNPFRVSNYNLENASAVAELNEIGQPVSAQFIGYLNGGVELLNRVSFQASFPIALVQLGNGTEGVSGVSNSPDVKPVAPMDLRLEARGILYRADDRSFKLGAVGSIWLPTGNRYSFGSDGGVSGLLGVAAEYELPSLLLVFNTGVQFRPDGGINNFEVGSEWRWGVGGFMPLRGGAMRIGAQIFGSTGITSGEEFKGSNTPIEWLVEGRMATDEKKRGFVGVAGGTRLSAGYAPDLRIVATAGYWFTIEDSKPESPGKRFKAEYAKDDADTDKDGLPDSVDLCPTEPEDKKPPNTDDGCPAPADRDGDGIPDSVDKCPDEKEDFDKIDDTDGCPEDDADKDNIGDAKDACPKEPGEPSPEPAKNGCPQFIRRITGSSEIQILKQVQFATGRATILPNSYPILDEVVRLLKVNPEIKHLAIEGHTDNRGSNDLNEKLSNDRANSVMQYIIDKGIEAGKLSAAGFGPKKPIADNNTNEGRQKNRRVEFHIRDKAENVAAPKE